MYLHPNYKNSPILKTLVMTAISASYLQGNRAIYFLKDLRARGILKYIGIYILTT